MELRIEHLTKTYPNGVRALNDVSLTIPRGMFGLLGPNGAGKSSLMRTLATLQEPGAGSVMLGDIDVLREKDRLRRTLGYLPQEFGVYPSVSAERLLDHFAILEGYGNRGGRRDVVEALLRQTNLWEVRKQRLGGFSGGMRQRFGIAIALLGNPSLIIVDEPTAGLDPAERVRFHNLLSDLGEYSVVILSTHIVEDVADFYGRMAIIDRGQILLEAEPLAAIDTLRGRVWKRSVAKSDLPGIEQDYRLICTKLQAGRTIVHVYADASPGSLFEPVALCIRSSRQPSPRARTAHAIRPFASSRRCARTLATRRDSTSQRRHSRGTRRRFLAVGRFPHWREGSLCSAETNSLLCKRKR